MESPSSNITIRSFKPADSAACQKLYLEGLIGGSIAPNDTGLDIDDIQHAYMESRSNHFWVAESDNKEIVGMIGVMQKDHVGEVKRLRVSIDHRRRGIGSLLVEQALKFCREHQCLKVALDTFVERDAAIKLFEKFNFKLNRTRVVNGKELSYFYLDLYSSGHKGNEQ